MPLSNEMFNNLSLFGDDEKATGLSPSPDSSEAMYSEIFRERYKMSVEYFVRLLGQTIILEAFLSCDFPQGTPRIQIRHILEHHIGLFCEIPFKLSQSSSTIRRLFDRIIEDLETLVQNIGSWNYQGRSIITREDHEVLRSQTLTFITKVNSYFAEIEDYISNITDSTMINDDLITSCVKMIEEHHGYGRDWAKLFFEFTTLSKAKLFIAHRKIRPGRIEAYRTQIETLSDSVEGRYILFTFSPQDFLIKQFTLLAFRFFHEYLSHLDACIFPIYDEDGIHIEDRIHAHRLAPIELKEGWMLHAAQTFFSDKSTYLLGESRQHLREYIQRELTVWLASLADYDNRAYVEQAERGFLLAEKFLTFLRLQICSNDVLRASILYYRISFDLITRYPTDGFLHLDFMNSLDFCLGHHSEKLVELVKLCLQSSGEVDYIDLDELWLKLRLSRPYVDLSDS